MSERRFVIKDVTDSMLSYEDSLQQVTESELKRRCFEICSIHYNTHCCFDWERYKSILLHGEWKEQPETDYFGYPMPKEQPADCEAWKADAPNPNNYNRWENWAIDVTNWIREMPRWK